MSYPFGREVVRFVHALASVLTILILWSTPCNSPLMLYLFLATNIFGLCVSVGKAYSRGNAGTWQYYAADYFELIDLMWFALGSVVALCSMTNGDAPVICGMLPGAIFACYLVGYILLVTTILTILYCRRASVEPVLA